MSGRVHVARKWKSLNDDDELISQVTPKSHALEGFVEGLRCANKYVYFQRNPRTILATGSKSWFQIVVINRYNADSLASSFHADTSFHPPEVTPLRGCYDEGEVFLE